MQIVIGKKSREMNREELSSRLEPFDEVLIDLGTGDGRFVLGWARQNPETFCIGVDAVQEAMRDTSRRAASKPARGGVPNALFVVASAEDLPAELTGLASRVTVNFPWGSLLRGVVASEPRILGGIVSIARPGAEVTVLINYTVFKDDAYRQRLGLPSLDLLVSGDDLTKAWRATGLAIDRRSLVNREVPYRTSWGQRLILGSDRETLRIEGHVVDGAEWFEDSPADG